MSLTRASVVVNCQLAFGVVFVAVGLPSVDFVREVSACRGCGDRGIGWTERQFGFGHVEPAAVLGRVVPFEPLDEPARFAGGEGLIERRWRVRVQVVLNQHDLLGVGKMNVG